ncbi:SPOR domain-containing protein [Sphingomonas sp.]|uniref:SPOR domain-containing protein n=1 Tax=Sphingomonas sp. TaxID=28214 RepID=UPI002EDB443D
MKSQTSLVLLLLAATGAGAAQRLEELPPATLEQGAPSPSTAPQGSSQLRPGEARFDRVGRATLTEGEGVFALSGELAAGSFAEVTALDSGKTILVQVRGQGDGLIALSGSAAAQLGVAGSAPVRVRRVTVTPQDSALLSGGQAAPTRADAPQALLVGLRRMLAEQAPVPAPARPAPPRVVKAPPAKPQPARPEPAKAQPLPARGQPAPAKPTGAARGLMVQVAALSNAQRARSLASQLGGTVRSAGNIHRVQLGPFADRAAAERARADAAKRGYGDARILSNP